MSTDNAQLQRWADELAAAYDFPEGFELDVDAVLDLARDAAHGVARPAAPLTTFLAGYAAGLRGGSAADVREAIGRATGILQSRDSAPDETADGADDSTRA
ncbi:hypothetical protein AS850_15090 [Frondihabitans sp. 762G35]|uniref:DUF6457 domain-containing protein n=1 Tax=Frondihabitans sp. 762G35 TaxID=1446794 RepID=UPI000D20CCF7|nr:DUF6457 domain-containing protein [Frondihabitans sp. 762G35]ARC58410.1 hypothetical protein AS850_15090 [Frondihabitans sp. 762G35]